MRRWPAWILPSAFYNAESGEGFGRQVPGLGNGGLLAPGTRYLAPNSRRGHRRLNFLGMGPLEVLLVAGLALVVFGPEKLPELGRHLGRLAGELRRLSAEVTSEFQRSLGSDGPGVARPEGSRQGSSTREAQPGPPAGDKSGDGPLPPY